MKIVHIVGNRPQFIKLDPLLKALKKHKRIKNIVVHTGQHYDFRMSQIFFKELNIPEPDYNLEVGSGSHALQTADAMMRLEPVLEKEKPDIVIVFGDTNTTLAGALTAVKMQIPTAHIEAGNRGVYLGFPEQINRLLVDHISDFLFASSIFEKDNLLKEGISEDKIFLVGNIMADALFDFKDNGFHKQLGLKNYAVLTLHRAETVDNKEKLKEVLDAVSYISKKIPVVFPIHPRTKKMIDTFGLTNNLKTIEPVSYFEMLDLVKNSKMVLTDSGGLQAETTILKIPCLTIRETNEWPITTKEGTNLVVGTLQEKIIQEATNVLRGESEIFSRKTKIPEFWDGKTAERIINVLLKVL
ncbi:hypothetical protein AMJ47_00360 [Parcubacteria bacterium DG_72]|nr:MAG: hypothetical protein AMJ47_00360 [Parcubacteria bacterium DG_72]